MKAPILATALLAALLGACKPATAPAPAPSGNASPITLSLSTNRIHIGDPVTVCLTARHAAGARVELPDLNRGREIVVRQQAQPEKEQSPDLSRFYFTITSLVPSNHVLSTNMLRITAADATATTQAFPFAVLEVQSLLQGTNTAMREAKGLASWPDPRVRTALIISIAAALILGLVILTLLLRARRARPAPPPPPPPPAHEWALAALALLRAKPYIAERQIEPFYVELSAIVRRYLERRFGLHAPERTTDEFIREAMSSRLLSGEQQQWVGAFLEQSDLVKFARHEPASADMESACAAAEQLVRETAAPPAPEGTAP